MTVDEVLELLRNEECVLDEYIYSQIAELLEELKFLREWKSDVIESLCKYDCNFIEEVAHNGYNKAIDDVIQKVKSMGLSGISSSEGNLIYVLESMKGNIDEN